MNLYETDAEFMERFERFAFTEIVNENGMKLDDETRYMSILASLIGCQGVDAYKVIVAKALDSGLSPMVIKEIVYQSVDYLGMGRVWPFLVATNVVMEAKGIELPLLDSTRAKQGRLGMTKQERLEKAASDAGDCRCRCGSCRGGEACGAGWNLRGAYEGSLEGQPYQQMAEGELFRE